MVNFDELAGRFLTDLEKAESRETARRFNEQKSPMRIGPRMTKDALPETRYVDPDTGGEKGAKLARFDLIPAEAIIALAEHFGRGAEKYEDRNWERGYPWSLSFAALQRHIWAFWNDEDIDPETRTHHAIAAMWHCVVLFTFANREIGTDDRPGA